MEAATADSTSRRAATLSTPIAPRTDRSRRGLPARARCPTPPRTSRLLRAARGRFRALVSGKITHWERLASRRTWRTAVSPTCRCAAVPRGVFGDDRCRGSILHQWRPPGNTRRRSCHLRSSALLSRRDVRDQIRAARAASRISQASAARRRKGRMLPDGLPRMFASRLPRLRPGRAAACRYWFLDRRERLFELADVPPGSHAVGVGLTSEMDPKTVYARTLLPNRDARGPWRPGHSPAPAVAALRAEGRPSTPPRADRPGVRTSSAARFRQVTTPVSTAADGTFVLSVFEGQSYTVRAFVSLPSEPRRQAQAAQVVTISGDPAPIRLVLAVR